MLEQPLGPNRKRRTRHRRHARIFLGACLVAGLGLAAAALFGVPIPARFASPHNSEPPASHDSVSIGEFASAMPPRPIYRYSVVNGGAYTAGELAQAIDRDPTVADHYRSIDIGHVRAETVASDQFAYMSYRRGDQIFWTKHRVRLRQGETILTDGTTQVRSRCGNCISLEPMQPTAEDEPDAVEFEALTNDPVIVPPEPLSAQTVTLPPGVLLPPPFGDAPFDPIGPMAIGPIAENIEDSGTDEPRGPGEPVDLGTPGGFFPGPPFPVPPSVPSSPDNPSGPEDGPPVIVDTPPPFEPPIDVPPDFRPDDEVPLDPEGPVPVPEPGTLLLVGGGLGVLVRRLRSKG